MTRLGGLLGALLAVLAAAGPVIAHITPPVVLTSDRDAVVSLLTGARRFFVREIRLSADERNAIKQQSGWTPDEDFYRFYLGRDERGQLVAATIFLTEFTLHGPVRVAVAVAPDGKIRGATVIELTEETYPWVKPLLDQNFTTSYVGQGSRGTFKAEAHGVSSMGQFYAQVIAALIQRAALLYDVGILGHGGA